MSHEEAWKEIPSNDQDLGSFCRRLGLQAEEMRVEETHDCFNKQEKFLTITSGGLGGQHLSVHFRGSTTPADQTYIKLYLEERIHGTFEVKASDQS